MLTTPIIRGGISNPTLKSPTDNITYIMEIHVIYLNFFYFLLNSSFKIS